MSNNTEPVIPKFEMDLMKKFQMLCSWSEFYFANKRRDQYEKIQETINELRTEITTRNTGIKNK